MLKLITGRSGSGKTYAVISEIQRCIKEKRNAVLIVPEQQVYSCERNILPILPKDAGLTFEILSFSRLAQKIALRYGKISKATPSKSTKALLMWRNLRELSPMLLEFSSLASSAADSSSAQNMLSAIDEFKYGNITSASIEAVSKKLDAQSPLAKKLYDMALISASFDGLVEEIYGENPSDRLTVAAKQLSQNDYFDGMTVFVDSFTSFTAQEYAIIKYMTEQADDIYITVAAEKNAGMHLYTTCDTANRLVKLSLDLGVKAEHIHLEGNKRTKSPELLHIEKNIWKIGEQEHDMTLPDHDSDVTLLTAENIYDEAEAAALNIQRLKKSGVNYSEMAIVVRDSSAWEGVLDAALTTYNIPFFISERTVISTRPATRLVLVALRAISSHWQRSDIMSLLHTGLVGISLDDIDMFDEYTDTWEISGKKFCDKVWSMNPDGYTTEISPRGKEILEAANRVRAALMTPLEKLRSSLLSAENADEQCSAIYDYLTSLSVKEQLAARAEMLLSRNMVKEAGEELRLWSFITEALVSLAEVMDGYGRLEIGELEAALNILFSSTDIGSVPARHDCVTVGSAATLRADNIKATIVLGLSDGDFPGAKKSSGILSEGDRDILRDMGIDLGHDDESDASDELFFIYRAFSMPSQKLIASHSTSTIDGKTKNPSLAFLRLKILLGIDEVYHFKSSSITERSNTAPANTLDSIQKSTAKALLGSTLYLSQARLQKYFNCPFSYYGSYVLKLREKCKAELGNLQAGNFLHHVLECFLRASLDENNSIKPLGQDEIQKIADEIILNYTAEICTEAQLGTGRILHLFSRMRTVAVNIIENVLDELRQSSFRPFGLEMNIDENDPNSPAPMSLNIDIDGDDGTASPVRLIFSGKIDRVDIYREGEEIFIRVIDYKSSPHTISEKDISDKMNVQLLIYLFTLCSENNRRLFTKGHEKISPASATYISYKEDSSSGTVGVSRTGLISSDMRVISAASNDIRSEFLPSVKVSRRGELSGGGLCTSERIANIERLMEDAVKDTARDMYNGVAERKPSKDACKYCIMNSTCPMAENSK